MHIVTSGTDFIDIDAFASMVALAELLRLQGEDAIAASGAPLNSSIPASLRQLNIQFRADYKPHTDDMFTIVDLSDPAYFDFGAKPDKVVGIIDHHLGFQDYWQEKLGSRAYIEFIGAACTQVYERWQEAGLQGNMSQDSAKLLACGILDNTLNLKASITTERDRLAYAYLVQHAGLPDNWPERYFSECQAHILGSIQAAIQNDVKTIAYPGRTDKLCVGQLTLWDADEIVQSNKDLVARILATEGLPWYMNFIDIKTGQSILFCQDPNIQAWLTGTLHLHFKGDLAHANRMWLRKEIMKQVIGKEKGHETN